MPNCLVTGAARRVGAALTEALARAGWTVAAHYNSSATDAEALAQRLGPDVIRPVSANLAEGGDVATLIARAEAAVEGPLTLLVNNASLFNEDRITTTGDGTWDAHLQVNLKAPVMLARDFAARLPDGETGLIVNLLDQKLWNLNPDFFSYTVAKAGLRAATEMMAQDLAPRIRVCGIAPGIALPSIHQSDDHFAKVHDMNPLNRGVTVQDIARALLFLVDSPTITGQTIIVDSGQHLSGARRDVLYTDKLKD